MDINVNLSHQTMRVATDLKKLVAGTQKFIRFVFKLPSEWDDFDVITAQFAQNGQALYDQLDANHAVYLPSGLKPGDFTLLIYGTKNNGEIRATVNALQLTLTPDAYISDASEVTFTENMYDQLVQIISGIAGRTEQDKITKGEIQEWVNNDTIAFMTEFVKTPDFTGLAIQDKTVEKRHLNDELQASIDRADSALQYIPDGSITRSKVDSEIESIFTKVENLEMVIPDASVPRSKVDADFEATLIKADSAMQPSVYDPNNHATDVFAYTDSKIDTVITPIQTTVSGMRSEISSAYVVDGTTYDNLSGSVNGALTKAKSYTDIKLADYTPYDVSIISTLPPVNLGKDRTFYLIPKDSGNGYDKWWLVERQDHTKVWDNWGGSATLIVDELPQEGDVDADYILAANGEYKYYKYIDGEWAMIAGGSAEILSIPLDNPHTIILRHGEPTDEVSEDDVTNGLVYLDIDTMDYYIADETTDQETEQTVYYWSEEGNLVENPSENKDYYYDNNGTYIHFRYSEDTFHQVGSPSTLIVTELPLTGDSDVDYILNKDGEYQYYKYIDNEWQMISGGSAEIINEDYIISKFISETPIVSEWNPLDHIGEHYILTNNLQHWFVEDNGSNDEHDYQWASEMLVAVPSTSKDYFVQFGITSDYLHFRYADDNKFHLVGSVTYSKDEIDNIIQGLNTTLGGEISELGSDVSELKSQMNNISNMVKDVTISQDKKTLTVTYMNDATSTIELDTGTDIDTTRYNIDDDHKLHFYDSQGNELDGLTVEITGAGGGGSAVSGSVTIGRISASNLQTIFGSECEIEYTVTAVDASGEDVGAGTGTLYVNNVAVLSGFTVNTSTDGAFNSINVGDYLSVGNNTIKISVNVDTGGESNTTTTKTWSVNAINMYLSWDYTDSQVNTSAVTDYYTPFGALSKTIYTFIDVEPVGFNPKIVDALPDTEAEDFDVDDVIGVNYFVRSGSNYTHYIYSEEDSEFVSGVGRMLDVNTTTRSGVVQTLSIPMQSHGSHAIVRFMTGDVNGEIISTATQVHDMVFAVAGEEDPIIATSFNTDTMNQYNTVQIPIVVYDPNRTATTVILAENGDVVSTWTGVDRTLHYWNYSPTTSGTKTLTIRCGSTTKTIVIEVTPLNITEEEIGGYDFRFKASEMATNSAVQDWSSTYRPNGQNETKEVKFTFSDNFDWINGGLHTEYDEDNHIRQFFCVRAGTYVTINYDLFGKEYDPKQYGKNFKFIFKAVNCRTYDANVLTCMDTAASNNGVGLVMTANEATLTTANNSLKTYYYKDSYIEFETNIHPNTEYPYLQFWMDGSHDVTKLYDSSDDIQQVTPVGITIGSPNCDVYIYMIKAYPIYLTNSNELSNFIMDAPNAYEMVARYNRNNILNANGEVDYQLLASANPDLHVIAMDINRMTTGKKDNVVAYSVRHIYNRGGLGQCFTINNACITVQGTSSVGYLESAGNVDINFKYNKTFTSDNVSYTTGEIVFDDGTTSTSGYSLSANSIPVDYLNVKVNVASSENANNACIADWYNTYQPWTSPARAKNPKARDTMEFVPGVIFIRDRSGGLFYTEQQDPQTGAVTKIPDTQNYHLYGICDIGNSKKNTKVFHDTKNPIACCVEVSNNTSLPCLMSSKDYSWNAKDEATVMELDPESGEMKEQVVFEFRYIDEDNSNTISLAKNAWDRFVEFMVDNNPNLATNELLPEPVTFGTYTFKGSGKYNTSSYESDEYNVIYLYGYSTPSDWGYAAADYVSDTTEGADCYYYINYSNDKIYSSDGTSWTEGATLTWTRDQNNVLGGTTIGNYAKTYTNDTSEYRIAYILNHCEEYMVIDPVVYHFIFIESFLMTDNVAKNTFWSSDDLVHWEPSKDYDNDTSLGNDNVGGLSFTYGLETDDTVGSGYVFNAHDASWITFCRGIFDACQTMYRNRESAGCFNSTNFLAKVKTYQNARPERVWVADAQRKYLRPYEDNNTITYIPMLAGKKTHQRAQVKTYNSYYYASKYVSDFCTSQNIMVRGNTPTTWTGVAPANTATLSMYINCYIVVASTSYNVVAKTKATRGQSYVMDFSTIGSMGETELYFCTAPMITELSGLAHLYFKQNNFGMGTNLQRLEIGSYVEGYENPNLENLTIGNNRMLEYLDVRNCPNATGALDLSGCLSLSELYLDNTAFTGITFATGGLIETAHLPSPTSLTMRELIYLTDLSLASANNLNTIRIEDCDFADSAELTIGETTTTQANKDIVLNLVDSASNLSRARLIGVDWLLGSTDTLNRLLKMAGIGDDSYNISQSVLTGSAYINGAVRYRELDKYAETWEYLDVTYNPNNIVEQYAATYVNDDNTQLGVFYVDRGALPPDPVEDGDMEVPTKASDAQYTYTFSGWDDIETVMLAPRTIKAQYTSTIRTYTVTWYSRIGVPIKSVQAEYGSEVVYDGEIPTRVDEEANYIYNIFMGWDKSTGYITGDTDVYAIWDRKVLPTVGKDLNDMSPAEIYGLGNASSINISDYLEAKDYKDIVVGNDFNFNNVESEVILENQWFDGRTHIDTDIQLFSEDSDDFTLAIDFEFYQPTSNATLVSCFEEEGSEGFRLRYSSGSKIQWGDKSCSAGPDRQRSICVLRHKKGSDKLFVYVYNTNSYQYDYSTTKFELTRTRSTSTNSVLSFGAIKFPDGGYDFYAKGWIHWCKIWYSDLGEANAIELAQWPHETWRAEYTSLQIYRLPGTSRYAKLSFSLNNLLLNGYIMSNSGSNAGGWPVSSLRTWLNDKIYKALPVSYRAILKRVRVCSNAGNMSQEIVYSDDLLYVPSLIEVSGNTQSPYGDEIQSSEANKQIPWYTSDTSRIKFEGQMTVSNPRVFSSSEDPTVNESNNVQAGDIWYRNTYGTYYMYIPKSEYDKHDFKGDNIVASNGGLWYQSAYSWWTRSPDTSYDVYYRVVGNSGNTYSYGYSSTSLGVNINFSV